MSDAVDTTPGLEANAANAQVAAIAVAPHPLTIDPAGEGFWASIDRLTDRASGWLNPILIKEARQALKSKQFLITFFSLLMCSWLWTILGIVLQTPDVYFIPTGETMLYGFYFVLAIPMLGMVPLVAHRSLAAEIDDGTFEMLAITKLSSMRIVLGKLNSAMLQMLIYFAAVVPGLAFSYLLRGVNMPTMVMLVIVVFFSAMLLTTFGLLVATLASHRAWQALALLAVIGVVLIAQFICGAVCLDGILGTDVGSESEAWFVLAAFVLVGATCMVLFIKAAAARIAPVTENRSTGLRWWMFLQQLVWIFTFAYLTFYNFGDPGFRSAEPMHFAMIVIAGYWCLMGTLMLAESPELSPRVQRGLPSTFAGRMLKLWFNPGPGTGFMFATCSGVTAMLVIGIFLSIPELVDFSSSSKTASMTMALLLSGYLLFYLGTVRLLVMLLHLILRRTFVVPIVVLAAVLFAGVIIPFLARVVLAGGMSGSHSMIDLPNWGWTIERAFWPGVGWEFGLLAFTAGGLVFALNLLLFFREFTYRRIAEPARLQAEQALSESDIVPDVLAPDA